MEISLNIFKHIITYLNIFLFRNIFRLLYFASSCARWCDSCSVPGPRCASSRQVSDLSSEKDSERREKQFIHIKIYKYLFIYYLFTIYLLNINIYIKVSLTTSYLLIASMTYSIVSWVSFRVLSSCRKESTFSWDSLAKRLPNHLHKAPTATSAHIAHVQRAGFAPWFCFKIHIFEHPHLPVSMWTSLPQSILQDKHFPKRKFANSKMTRTWIHCETSPERPTFCAKHQE